ncbi:MAG: PLP-dependent aminotransferase family protein [Oscillospiraceae bacterium]|nr:PLP-dependent aminotransferase family protein [Oscillospiraceae bacterium]
MLILDEQSKIPLYVQLYEYIKAEILSGRITAGQKLKSGRDMSVELQISRNTVDLAYGQLAAEGFIVSEPRKGYYVETGQTSHARSEAPHGFAHMHLHAHAPFLQRDAAHSAGNKAEPNIDFRGGKLLLSELPFNQWQKLTAGCFLDYRENLAQRGTAFGEPGLRAEIEKYIRNYRDVVCSAEQIIVTPGTQFSLELVCRLLKTLKNEPALAMEEPGYERSRLTFQDSGLKVCPVRLDRYGLSAEELSAAEVSAVYVTPSHQFPTGIVMPASRRAELAALAESRDLLIIEDDYNCHFQHSQRPIPSIQSLCADRTIYIGGFSDIMLPSIQISFMVVPERLLEQLRKWYDGYAPFVPFLSQKPMELFMREGHWERHLRKTRKLQRLKCEALVGAFKDKFGDSVRLSGVQTGLHLLVRARWFATEADLILQARNAGVLVYPTSAHWSRAGDAPAGTVLLNYGGVELEDIPVAVERLHRAWRGS